MARIVVLEDTSPLVIKKDEMEGDVVAVCRCGLSAGWPMCDGSHNAASDEDEASLSKYEREGGELQRSPAGDVEGADPRA